MLKDKKKNENGAIEVEATLILPMVILITIILLYISLYVCQRAILQANLETAALYCKAQLTDNYVHADELMAVTQNEDTQSRKGSTYKVTGPLNPYRITKEPTKEQFSRLFFSEATNLYSRENLKITHFDVKNNLINKTIEVTVKQDFKLPIDFSYIGVGDHLVISATTKVVATDHDQLIRDIDYIADIMDKTGVTDYITQMANGAKEMIDRFGE